MFTKTAFNMILGSSRSQRTLLGEFDSSLVFSQNLFEKICRTRFEISVRKLWRIFNQFFFVTHATSITLFCGISDPKCQNIRTEVAVAQSLPESSEVPVSFLSHLNLNLM